MDLLKTLSITPYTSKIDWFLFRILRRFSIQKLGIKQKRQRRILWI